MEYEQIHIPEEYATNFIKEVYINHPEPSDILDTINSDNGSLILLNKIDMLVKKNKKYAKWCLENEYHNELNRCALRIMELNRLRKDIQYIAEI